MKGIIIDKYKNILNQYISNTKEVLTKFNCQNKTNQFTNECFNILRRTYYGIQAIECLVREFERDVNFKYPIALQTRTCLLDVITLCYLYEFAETNDKYQEELARINHIAVKQIFKELETSIDNKKELEFLYSIFPYNIQWNDNLGRHQINNNIKSIRPGDMNNSIKIGKIKYFSGAYQCYKYYSQYEHYGTFTQAMLAHAPEYEFEKLLVSTSFILRVSNLCYSHLNCEQNTILNLEGLIDELKEIIEANLLNL